MTKSVGADLFAGLDYDTANNVLFSYVLGRADNTCRKLMRRTLLKYSYKPYRYRVGMFTKIHVLADSRLAPVVAVVVKGRKADVLVYTSQLLPWGKTQLQIAEPIVEMVDGELIRIEPEQYIAPELVYTKDAILQAVQQDILDLLPQRKKPTATRCLLLLTASIDEQLPPEYKKINMSRLYRKLRGYKDDIISSYCKAFVLRRGKIVHKKK